LTDALAYFMTITKQDGVWRKWGGGLSVFNPWKQKSRGWKRKGIGNNGKQASGVLKAQGLQHLPACLATWMGNGMNDHRVIWLVLRVNAGTLPCFDLLT